MCGAQQLQCKSESAPQIIGAHQPHQACNEYTHVHCFDSTVTTGWKRGYSCWDSWATLSEPRSLGTGARFLISESGRGGGSTATSFATRLRGICNASQNRMEEGALLGNLSQGPLDWGLVPPPLVSEFYIGGYSSVLSSATRLQGI